LDAANRTDCEFPIQNLPFAVFRRGGSVEEFRGGVAIGDQIVDLAALAKLELFHEKAAQ
jgi:fumarylacetoacetase